MSLCVLGEGWVIDGLIEGGGEKHIYFVSEFFFEML